MYKRVRIYVDNALFEYSPVNSKWIATLVIEMLPVDVTRLNKPAEVAGFGEALGTIRELRPLDTLLRQDTLDALDEVEKGSKNILINMYIAEKAMAWDKLIRKEEEK